MTDPATATATPSKRNNARLRKQRQRERDKEIRRLAVKAAAEAQECLDEDIAPAVQRKAMTGPDGAILRNPNGAVIATMPDGTVLREALRNPDNSLRREPGERVLRAARLVRDGVGFTRADPLAHIAAEIDGGSRTFTLAHYKAGKQLRDAWDAVGDGVGLGASDWGKIRSPQGTAPSTPAGHSSLVAQVERRMEIEGAAAFLGALWPAVRDMVLIGMSLAAWADGAGLDDGAAVGYLRAGLDRAVEWDERRNPPTMSRTTRIRTIAPGREAYSAEA